MKFSIILSNFNYSIRIMISISDGGNEVYCITENQCR